MGLREQAATDLITILTDVDGGFGWRVTVQAPDGNRAELVGFTSDIAQALDLNTGQLISGRTVSLVLPLAPLLASGLGDIRVSQDPYRDPWIVQFTDALGRGGQFVITEARPDRTIGAVSCSLTAYTDNAA